MSVGWQQLLIVLVLVLVLFGGRGRISSLMGDMAQGIKSFRTGLKDEDEPAPAAALTAEERVEADAALREAEAPRAER